MCSRCSPASRPPPPSAPAAPAAPTPPPAPARFAFAFAVLGYGGGRRFDVLVLRLHLRLLDDAFIFQVVFVLQRRGDGSVLVLLGERACRLDGVHLLAAVGHEG